MIHWIIHSNDSFRKRFIQEWNIALRLEMHDILHAIVMRITSVKTVLWLAVNLHHLFSNGAAFNKQSRSSLTSYAICAQNCRWIACDSEREIALLVSNLWLCVLNAALFENRWWRFTANHRTIFTDANHRTVFTDVMLMTIACNISCSPNLRCTNVLIQLCLELFSLVKQKENRQYCVKIIILIIVLIFLIVVSTSI